MAVPVVRDWDDNRIALGRVTLEGPTIFTPTWNADSSAPALGNGTLIGKKHFSRQLAIIVIRLAAGSTTTFGTGAWYFGGFPPAGYASPVIGCVAWGNDADGTPYSGVGRFATAAKLYAYLGTTIVDATHPFTWATNDVLELTAVYPLSEA